MGWLQKMRHWAQVQMRLKMRKLDRVQALRQMPAVQHFQVWIWTLWAIVLASVGRHRALALSRSDAQLT